MCQKNNTILEKVVTFMQTEISGNGQMDGYTCEQHREDMFYRKIQ